MNNFSFQFLQTVIQTIQALLTFYRLWKLKLLSCVQLFASPWTIQYMEFSRPEYWNE